jgi:hypothetical protein
MLNRVAVIIDKIRYDRKWQIGFVAACSLIILIFFLFFLTINSNNKPQPPIAQRPINNETVVTNNDFESGEYLTPVFGKNIGISRAYAFTSAQKAIVVDDNQFLTLDGVVLSETLTFYPESIYSVSQSIIINEPNRSTLYQNPNQFTPYPENVFSVTPALLSINGDRTTPGFIFLRKEGRRISILQSTEINLSNPQLLNSIALGDGVEFSEIKIINNNPYFLTYQNIVKQGLAEVFLINRDNSLVKVQEFTNLESIKFGDFGIMTTFKRQTANNLTQYTQRYIDFSKSVNGESVVADFNTELARLNIFGSILAHRCNITSAEEVVCLIKKDKYIHTDFQRLDKLVRYNFTTKNLSLINEGSIFSADSILEDRSGTLYIISQESRNLYQVNIQ